jgi:hypothetical protein
MDNKKLFADGMFAYETDKDWLPMRISFRVKEFAETLIKYKDLADQNDGKLNIDIKKSSKGSLFAEINTWKKEREVTTADHSPDRQEADLPF